jgi:hypothetical protein
MGSRHRTEQTEDRCWHAETLRVRGDVLLAMGDRAGAEAGYNEAIAIAQQQSAKLWELRAGMSLARLWRDLRRCSRSTCTHLQLVHRGLRSAGPARGQGAAR